MERTYRPVTDGAGQEIVADLTAILSMLQSGTKTTVDPSAYTDKALLTEATGRNIAAKLTLILNALETYCAPSAAKTTHKVTIGTVQFDGSQDVAALAATQAAAGLLSAADKTKLDSVESGAQVNTVTGIKGNAESSYRTGNVNLTPANIGAEPAFTKNSAFNKAFGTAANTVCQGNDSRLSDSRPASDVYAWAKAATKPSYGITEIIGSSPIGNKYQPVYYDGSKFVAKPFSLASATWEEINEIAQAGEAASVFHVGDEKTIELSTSEKVTLVILGFNHDDLTAGGKAKITFGMKELLATKYKMNNSDTNVGGWDSSIMRTSTMATLLSQLPADLQAVIKQVNKKTTAGNQQTTITTSVDKLFLFSTAELRSETSAGYKDEGTTYEYWTTRTANADRIKKLSNGAGSANTWWLRSPVTGGATNFRYIRTSGNVYSNFASSSSGVCFGFCV